MHSKSILKRHAIQKGLIMDINTEMSIEFFNIRRRMNIDVVDDDIYICYGQHEKQDKCEFNKASAEELSELIKDLISNGRTLSRKIDTLELAIKAKDEFLEAITGTPLNAMYSRKSAIEQMAKFADEALAIKP